MPGFEPFEGEAPEDAPSVVVSHAHEVRAKLDHRDAFWPAQLAVGCAILLYLTLPDKLTIGPTWLLPVVEGGLLVGLVIATPHPKVRYSARRRHVAIGLIAFVTAVSLSSLMLLVHYLLKGGKAGGHPLILAGVVLWLTNVLIFALWYWELDRGGPVARALDGNRHPDFLFVQMTEPAHAPAHWLPSFVDYLYLSFTNATAFSPTDTMPLTAVAKALMTVQSLAALVTVGLVVARAVNILA